jgi:outer membrane protein OmpA-like peptidoglycan-associated protein
MIRWRVILGGCAVVSLAIGLVPGAAHAQSDSSVIARQARGIYIGGAAGLNLQEDNRFRDAGTDSTTSYDPGFAGLLNLGYAFGNGLRVEIEPGYRRNGVDKINGAGGSGHTEIASVMANAIYDLDIHTPFVPLIPHIGIGAGFARVWNRSSPHNGLVATGHDDVPAFQAIAGVEYAWRPNIKIGLDYRYFVAHDADFHVESTGLTTRAGDINDHSVLLTFRYEFGAPAQPAVTPAVAPPPPPPPPPAAPPATEVQPPPPAPRAYNVYFALNSARLTPDAQEIIRQAAETAKQGNATRIDVTGHTDTTGSARYNRILSMRRAAAVREALIRDGVPAGDIAATGRGQEDLAVPTAAGVNEPRNRRVEIVVRAPGT